MHRAIVTTLEWGCWLIFRSDRRKGRPMFTKRSFLLVVTSALWLIGSGANAAPTFTISGPATIEPSPYDIESAFPNFDPPWGIQQFPSELIYRSLSPSTGTTLVLSARSNVTFQYLGHGDANFVNEFKVLNSLGAPLLIWCTQGSSVVGCPAASVNPGFENGPTTPVASSTTVELHNLPAGPLNFEFIGNISAEGAPGPGSGVVFNTAASNTCGLDAAAIGSPPHPGDVCFGIAVPNGSGTNGLNTVKLGFKDGGQGIPYDPDYQDMVVMATISSIETAVPATNPQGLIALAVLLAGLAAWHIRKVRG